MIEYSYLSNIKRFMLTSKNGYISLFATTDITISNGINVIHTDIGFFCDRGIYLFLSEGKAFAAMNLVVISPCVIPMERRKLVIKTYSEQTHLLPAGSEIAIIVPSILAGMGAVDLTRVDKSLWDDIL